MALTVFGGAVHYADDGILEAFDLVERGGTLGVAAAGSGGTIEDTTVSGTANVYSGGSAISSLVTGVWSSAGDGTTFINGGEENVFSGYPSRGACPELASTRGGVSTGASTIMPLIGSTQTRWSLTSLTPATFSAATMMA
jgi:hypothetical protein